MDKDLFDTDQTVTYAATYGGYSTSGVILGANICMYAKDTPYFCNVYSSDFYVADAVYQNDWSYDTNAQAGIFGFGNDSPVWKIVGQPTTKLFDVYLTNFNSWTWAQTNYVATTTGSVMNFGQHSTDYTSADNHTTFAPFQQGSYLFGLKQFGFGVTWANNTEFYEDVSNWDTDVTVYGLAANTTSLALDFRGLGLPKASFNKFANLLSVATKGESTCLSVKSGYCALSQPCEHYNSLGLWSLDFKVQMETSEDDNYMRIPLATFAANYE